MSDENKTKLDTLQAQTAELEADINGLLNMFHRKWPGMIVDDISVDLIHAATPRQPEQVMMGGVHVTVRLNR